MMRQSITRFVVVLMLTTPALAGGTVKDALSQVPGNAMGVICVPSLEQLDQGYQHIAKEVELGPDFPPSLMQALQGFMPPLAKMDQGGALTIVVMPVDNMMMMNRANGIIVPAKEPKALLEAFGAQPGAGDVWSVNVMGQPLSAKALEDRIVLAEDPEILSALANVKESLADKLSADEMKGLEDLNFLIWLDTDQLFKVVGPMIEGMMAMGMAGQASSDDEWAAKQAEASKKQLDLVLKGLSTLGIGASVNKAGLGLRFLITTKTGSELAAQAKLRTTDGSLLSGLPAGDYVFAGGELVHPDAAKYGMEQIDLYAGMLGSMAGIDKNTLGEIKGLLKEWAPMATGARGMIAALPAKADGVFAVSGIVDTTDSNKWLDLLGTTIDKAIKVASDPKLEAVDDETRAALKAVTFKKNAEEISGVKVHHLAVDFNAIEDIDEDDLEEMQSLLGKDGFVIRFAAATEKAVVVSFGGGKANMAKLLASAKQGATGLDSNPGIKKAAASLPKTRAMVGYIDVDQIFAAINTIMKKMDEEPLPVKVPVVGAPLAMSTTGGDRWVRVDVFMPLEVVKATKSIVEQLTGTGSVNATADSSKGM